MGMPETGDAKIRGAGNGERCKVGDAANWDRWNLVNGKWVTGGRDFGRGGQWKVGIKEKGRRKL